MWRSWYAVKKPAFLLAQQRNTPLRLRHMGSANTKNDQGSKTADRSAQKMSEWLSTNGPRTRSQEPGKIEEHLAAGSSVGQEGIPADAASVLLDQNVSSIVGGDNRGKAAPPGDRVSAWGSTDDAEPAAIQEDLSAQPEPTGLQSTIGERLAQEEEAENGPGVHSRGTWNFSAQPRASHWSLQPDGTIALDTMWANADWERPTPSHGTLLDRGLAARTIAVRALAFWGGRSRAFSTGFSGHTPCDYPPFDAGDAGLFVRADVRTAPPRHPHGYPSPDDIASAGRAAAARSAEREGINPAEELGGWPSPCPSFIDSHGPASAASAPSPAPKLESVAGPMLPGAIGPAFYMWGSSTAVGTGRARHFASKAGRGGPVPRPEDQAGPLQLAKLEESLRRDAERKRNEHGIEPSLVREEQGARVRGPVTSAADLHGNAPFWDPTQAQAEGEADDGPAPTTFSGQAMVGPRMLKMQPPVRQMHMQGGGAGESGGGWASGMPFNMDKGQASSVERHPQGVSAHATCDPDLPPSFTRAPVEDMYPSRQRQKEGHEEGQGQPETADDALFTEQEVGGGDKWVLHHGPHPLRDEAGRVLPIPDDEGETKEDRRER